MIDIKFIRNNPEYVKQSINKRNISIDNNIDQLIEFDKNLRKIQVENDQIKFSQNKSNKTIASLKKEGKSIEEETNKLKTLSEVVKQNNFEISNLKEKISNILYKLPNIPNKDVPVGRCDKDNVEIRRVGNIPKFDFEAKYHWVLGEELNILDFESASKVTGSRFTFYKMLGAQLERAVINFFLDSHNKRGYKEIFPPFIVNSSSLKGTGQLPKFEQDLFKLENSDYYLIPTAEVPITNIHRDEIILGDSLPINYCAYSACFRSEAGSAGKDTRGLIRQHQFNKVELVKFVNPDTSYQELEKLLLDAENLLKQLELPYRVVMLSTGDLGFSSSKTYDIEVYMPSYGDFKEISSCSNFEEFQARRANIRYKNNITDNAKFVHTLNGSGLAVGRTVAAILENYQLSDGSIKIPSVLVKYMNGIEFIKKETF